MMLLLFNMCSLAIECKWRRVMVVVEGCGGGRWGGGDS